jgi:hypothetical protein
MLACKKTKGKEKDIQENIMKKPAADKPQHKKDIQKDMQKDMQKNIMKKPSACEESIVVCKEDPSIAKNSQKKPAADKPHPMKEWRRRKALEKSQTMVLNTISQTRKAAAKGLKYAPRKMKKRSGTVHLELIKVAKQERTKARPIAAKPNAPKAEANKEKVERIADATASRPNAPKAEANKEKVERIADATASSALQWTASWTEYHKQWMEEHT